MQERGYPVLRLELRQTLADDPSHGGARAAYDGWAVLVLHTVQTRSRAGKNPPIRQIQDSWLTCQCLYYGTPEVLCTQPYLPG